MVNHIAHIFSEASDITTSPAIGAVAGPSPRSGATPALVPVRESGIVLDLSAQPVPGAAGTLTNRQPGVVIVARAPPVEGSVHRVVS